MTADLMTSTRPKVATPVDLISATAAFADFPADVGLGLGQASCTRYLDRYLNNLTRLSEAAEELGYGGLERACLIVWQTVEALLARGGPLPPQTLRALETWVELVRWHLELPPGAGATEALVHFLRLPNWKAPLDQANAAVFQALMLEERRQAAAEKGPADASPL